MNKETEQRKPHWDLVDKKAFESNTIDLDAYALGVEDGVKWAQERSFSKEDLRETYFSAIESTGEGWNGEYAGGNDPNIEEKFKEGFNKWFEQIKKK